MNRDQACDWAMFVEQVQVVIMVAMDNDDLQKALIANWQIFIEMDLKRIIRSWTFENEPEEG